MNQIFFSDEDIPFTNWGITEEQFEPLNESNLLCASICLGNECDDHAWKTVSCDTPQQFICQVDCKSFSNTKHLTKLNYIFDRHLLLLQIQKILHLRFV